ncbi:MAG: hypothetical protein AAF431_07530 [Pseudomonadota bacterium]
MDELKVLEGIIESLSEKSAPLCTKLWFKVLTWLFLVVASYFMYGFVREGGSLLIVILGSLFIGAFVAKNALDEQGFKAWSFMKEHIDKESVKKRIYEINT